MNQLAKYIDGTGSEEEKQHFITALIQAKFDRDKKREWTKKLAEQHGINRAENKEPGFWSTYSKPLSIAASLLLLIAAYFSWSTLSPKSLQASVDQHIATLSIMGDQAMLRKGGPEVDAIRSAATQYYVKQNYTASLSELERLVTLQKATATDYFYIGICQLKKSPADAPAAIAALQKTSKQKFYESEISWVLALAYLKAGQQEKGISQLEAIVANEGYQWKAAVELLKK